VLEWTNGLLPNQWSRVYRFSKYALIRGQAAASNSVLRICPITLSPHLNVGVAGGVGNDIWFDGVDGHR
jgi:hypothetical protein